MAKPTSRTHGWRAAFLPTILFTLWSLGTAADAQQTQVQRGEYLARAGDCVSCHTALPYALARPKLRAALGERDLSEPQRVR